MNLQDLSFQVYVIDLVLYAYILASLSLSGSKLIEVLRLAKSDLKNFDPGSLYKYLGLLKAISSSSTLIGLGGTVLSIISALQTMGNIEVAGNFMALATPIGLALKSTFLGICAAVPSSATLAYLSVAHARIQDRVSSRERVQA